MARSPTKNRKWVAAKGRRVKQTRESGGNRKKRSTRVTRGRRQKEKNGRWFPNSFDGANDGGRDEKELLSG